MELREVALRDLPASLLSASPKGTVPVLVLPDGKVVDESRDIMLWVLRLNDPSNWLGTHEYYLPPANELLDINDGAFKTALDRILLPG